jgi:predicted DNA-binding transcriptional regulator YafY
MSYVKFSGEQKEYTINPYHLAAYHGEWYLLGHHLKRKCEVTFAVSRIKKIKGLGLYFPPPVKELIEENLARGFGINYGGPVYDVHLRCTPKISRYISSRVWHGSQRIERRKDGSVDLFMNTSGWKELVRFVLSWQPDMTVMAPAELRDRIKNKMLDALKENW